MNRNKKEMEDNLLRDLINQVCESKGITKKQISKDMGYKDPTTFYATIDRNGLPWRKFQTMLDVYKVDVNLIFN